MEATAVEEVGRDAQAWLLTNRPDLPGNVRHQIEKMITKAAANGNWVKVDSLDDAGDDIDYDAHGEEVLRLKAEIARANMGVPDLLCEVSASVIAWTGWRAK